MYSPRLSNLARFDRALSGFNAHTSALFRAQQQISTGLRFSRPSEDPAGSARATLLERRVSEADRFYATAEASRGVVDATASSLSNASDILNSVRSQLIEGLNGTLSQNDRDVIAKQIELTREELLSIANADFDKRYVFGGTATGTPPWEEVDVGGTRRVRYRGSDESVDVQVGASFDITIGVPGTGFFTNAEPSGLVLSGWTGARVGTSPNQGAGYEQLEFRVDQSQLDATLLAGGVALANGGADDTALGTSALAIDAVAGTVSFGGGTPVAIPDPADPAYVDLVVKNAQGGEVHLDLSAWAGASVSGTADATGSVSIDGSAFQPIDFAATDFELESGASGSIVHLDLTGVRRAGTEVARFSGTVNLFDALEGFSQTLRNEGDMDPDELRERMNLFLDEFDRGADGLRNGLVEMGARSAQLQGTQDRLSQTRLQMAELLSGVRDTDFGEAVLNMTQAETMLQVAQSTGARIIQNSLLNFLR